MTKRPINLNQARKRRAKAAKERASDANRRWHGLSRAERDPLLAERERDERQTERKRLDSTHSKPGGSDS